MRNYSENRGNLATVYLGLGCNTGRCVEALDNAISALAALGRPGGLRASAYYDTTPQHKADQPDYLNAVVELPTALPPSILLAGLNRIERDGGRDRSREARYGPRTIDLDILLYGELVIRSDWLTVPHPMLHRRAFALVPLLELWPAAVDPQDGHAYQEDLNRCIAAQRVVHRGRPAR